MTSGNDVARLVQEAAASMKSDVKGAVAKLTTAFEMAYGAGAMDDASFVAEELARGWARRKSLAKSLHYAIKATKLTPEQKSTWATLGKTCELVACRIPAPKARRSQALFRASAAAYKKAASMATDREDKQWLLELAGDAARQAKPKA